MEKRIVLIVFVLMSLIVELSAQYKISGRVFNDNDEPLTGASVFLRNSDFATITDDNGFFEFDGVEDPLQTLVCTHIGYKRYLEYLELIDDLEINIYLEGFAYDLNAVEITTNRLDENAPFAYTTVTDDDLEDLNLGHDVPFLLRYTPNAVVTSDAGAGIGYTGIKIRGSDPTRINVTINGVPLNDSESQTVFWVDLPDFGSSVADIQVQRGVGTSTNGTGAFGGTIGVNTHQTFMNEYAELNTSFGSFGTKKLNVKLGSGLLNNSIFMDGRFSILQSDGFVDRASSDLRSIYLSLGKITSKSTYRFDYFTGTEETYQAWYGTPQAKFNGDENALVDHYNTNIGSLYNTTADSINLFDSDQRYNYYTYENQVDRYSQNHFQLHWNNNSSEKVESSATLHYTRGLGFFEQFNFDDDLTDYGIDSAIDTVSNEIITSSNLVRRKWLDNHFFGGITNFKFNIKENLNLHWGTAFHYYTGDHYGRLVSSEDRIVLNQDRNYYFNTGKKSDFNTFLKLEYNLNKLNLFGDIQFRNVGYKVEGVDDDNQNHNIDDNLNFINPKFGLSYNISTENQAYFSFAVGNREPDRNDYLSKPAGESPTHETLYDYELGFRSNYKKLKQAVNLYFMDYTNQLVITGELNDVGANLRTNVPDSYRAGIEYELTWSPIEKFAVNLNAAYSQNKIKEFTEIIYDYTDDFGIIENVYNDTDIALSPEIVAASSLSYMPMDKLVFTLQSKYVGDQFLDNTSNENKKLDGFFVNNLLASYEFDYKKIDHIRLNLMVNNLLNVKYASNGYTYSYVFGDPIVENYVYPQAGINFLIGLSVRI